MTCSLMQRRCLLGWLKNLGRKKLLIILIDCLIRSLNLRQIKCLKDKILGKELMIHCLMASKSMSIIRKWMGRIGLNPEKWIGARWIDNWPKKIIQVWLLQDHLHSQDLMVRKMMIRNLNHRNLTSNNKWLVFCQINQEECLNRWWPFCNRWLQQLVDKHQDQALLVKEVFHSLSRWVVQTV